MTKTELTQWLESKGFKQDSYGHYQKTDPSGKVYRFKIQDTSVRYEAQIRLDGTQYSKPKNEWLRIRSNYYKNLSLVNDKLHGLVR